MKDATLAQGNQVTNLILQKQTPSGQLQKLLESGLLSDLLDANLEDGVDRNAFRRLIGLKPLNVFSVTVNYDLSVKDAVAAGKYDWVNSDITGEHFPSTRKGTTESEIILVHFNRYMESDDVIRELDKQSLRAAELPELLAFGAKYPDVQRDFPVVALGSVWRRADGPRVVAFLYRLADERNLHLDWFGNRWRDAYSRFAAVRK